MNSSLRWKCRCMGKAAFLAILLGFPGTVSLPLVSSRTLRAQEELELRPLRGPAGAKKGLDQRGAGATADKVSPEVSQLIRKVLAGRTADQKTAEAKLRTRGLRVVPELRSWIQQVTGNAENIEIVLRTILRDVAGDQGEIDLVSRESSAGRLFEQKLEEAQGHFEYGRHQLARKMAEAILLLDPDSPLRFLCRR